MEQLDDRRLAHGKRPRRSQCPDRRFSVLSRLVIGPDEAAVCRGGRGRLLQLSQLDSVALVLPSTLYQSWARSWVPSLVLRDRAGRVLKINVESVLNQWEEIAAAVP